MLSEGATVAGSGRTLYSLPGGRRRGGVRGFIRSLDDCRLTADRSIDGRCHWWVGRGWDRSEP